MDARVDRLHHLVYHRKLDEVVVPRAAVIANVVPPCCRVVFHLTIRFCFFFSRVIYFKKNDWNNAFLEATPLHLHVRAYASKCAWARARRKYQRSD